MIELRPCETNDDLEAWRQVRIAVLPNERCETVEWIGRSLTPERLYMLAELDGALAGSGLAGRSDLGGAGLHPRVLPWARRRGVGTALLLALAEHAAGCGFDEAGTIVNDAGSLAFAERFGFREVDREVEQVRTIGDEPAPPVPGGIELVAVADRPELWRAAYDPLALQAFADMALDRPLRVSLEQWERDWLSWPEAMFLAVAGGEVVGCAGLERDADDPGRAENALTAVRRDRRGEGIASALKRVTLAFAAANGVREVYTWTQQGNDEMRRLNEHLGYVTRSECIRVRAPLEAVEKALGP